MSQYFLETILTSRWAGGLCLVTSGGYLEVFVWEMYAAFSIFLFSCVIPSPAVLLSLKKTSISKAPTLNVKLKGDKRITVVKAVQFLPSSLYNKLVQYLLLYIFMQI